MCASKAEGCLGSPPPPPAQSSSRRSAPASLAPRRVGVAASKATFLPRLNLLAQPPNHFPPCRRPRVIARCRVNVRARGDQGGHGLAWRRGVSLLLQGHARGRHGDQVVQRLQIGGHLAADRPAVLNSFHLQLDRHGGRWCFQVWGVVGADDRRLASAGMERRRTASLRRNPRGASGAGGSAARGAVGSPMLVCSASVVHRNKGVCAGVCALGH